MQPTSASIDCVNIGPRERALRVRIGWVGTVLTVATAAALLATRASWPVRLLVALPAATAAMGFLQARAKTCVAFAKANLKVLGDSRKDAVAVTDPAERAAFARTARTIYLQALGVTAAVVALVLALP